MRNVPKTFAPSETVTDEELAGVEVDAEDAQIVSRPDGYYWIAPDGRQEIGPFDSREMALLDMGSAADDVPEPGESLQEAEDEIGIADWIDPDTGEPSEGQSNPRFYSE